jgi:hypothetical protein
MDFGLSRTESNGMRDTLPENNEIANNYLRRLIVLWPNDWLQIQRACRSMPLEPGVMVSFPKKRAAFKEQLD